MSSQPDSASAAGTTPVGDSASSSKSGARALLAPGRMRIVVVGAVLALAATIGATFQPLHEDPLAPASFWQGQLLYPVERNAVFRDGVPALQINDVFLAHDGAKAWAVGSSGEGDAQRAIVLRSDDGGASWESVFNQKLPAAGTQTPSPAPAPAADATPPNAADAGSAESNAPPPQVQAADFGKLDTGSKKGDGASFANQAAQQAPAPAEQQQFSSPDDRAALEAKLQIAKNDLTRAQNAVQQADANLQALEAKGDKAAMAEAFAALDKARAEADTAATEVKVLEAQLDAAATAASDYSEALNSISMATDGVSGWAAGSNGVLFKTVDGGANWWAVSAPFLVGRVQFGDDEAGWVAGTRGYDIAYFDHERFERITRPFPFVFEGPRDSSKGFLVNESCVLQGLEKGEIRLGMDLPSGEGCSRLSVSGDSSRFMVARQSELLLGAASLEGWTSTTPSPTPKDVIQALALTFDGKQGWVGTESGAILSTNDDGATWQRRDPGDIVNVQHLKVSDSGRQVLAVTGTEILSSGDGGNSWEKLVHRRHPARWLYLSWCVIGFVGFVAWNQGEKKRDPNVETIGDEMDSDQPVVSLHQDKLDFAPIVSALDNFIRNEETKPPVTIAINGDWGTGKSSLMSMLVDSLRRRGSYPVWFNAWHHQSEQLTLVPFLQHVCTQAVPPGLTRTGLRFRLRLAWLRVLRHPVNLGLLLFGIVLPLAYFAFHDFTQFFAEDNIKVVLSDLGAVLKPFGVEKETIDDASTAIATLISPTSGKVFWILLMAIPAWILALDALRAFPEVPAILFATWRDKFRLSEAEAQASFRQNFSRHFDDVIRALQPQPVVVFVDDIDRCTKENAMEMLECANFLVNAGPCFVVLGLARERVEALVGLANAEFAEETADEEESDARENRRFYARQYLEKLIQVEINVPTPPPAALLRVLGVEKPKPADPLKPPPPRPPFWLTYRQHITMVCCAVLFAAVAVWIGYSVPGPVALSPDMPLLAEGGTGGGGAAPEPQPAPPPSTEAVVFANPHAAHGAPDLANFLPWIILLGTAGVLTWSILRMPQDLIIRNSAAYKAAVAAWQPLIARRRSTPRAVKQFGNMARYAAMMMRSDTESRHIIEGITAEERAQGITPDSVVKTETAAERDEQIVALCAIHHANRDFFKGETDWLFKKEWEDALDLQVIYLRNGLEKLRSEGKAGSAAELKLIEAESMLETINKIIPQATKSWPPRDQSLKPKFFKYVVATFAVEEPSPASATPATPPGTSPPAGAPHSAG